MRPGCVRHIFNTGEIKTRGIELRRGDTAPWIKAVQQQAIELLAAAHTREEFFEQVPHVIDLIRDRSRWITAIWPSPIT
ncbi:MAG TPA: hypothetical protein VMP08_13790 [Anaerolineae bacterium]|nr:hypothetical protein [Anaerolineae bacterium]